MTNFLIRSLAAWRLTRLIVDDEIARPGRDAVMRRFGPESKVTYLVNCPYCVSVWAGFAAVLMPRRMAGALAASAATLGIKWVANTAELSIGAIARRNK